MLVAFCINFHGSARYSRNQTKTSKASLKKHYTLHSLSCRLLTILKTLNIEISIEEPYTLLINHKRTHSLILIISF